MPNGEMLFRTLDRVVASPEEHTQHSWRTLCGSGCCFAGHAALEAGGVWLNSVYDGVTPDHRAWMIAEPSDRLWSTELVSVRSREDGGEVEIRAIHVSDRAMRVLELDHRQRNQLFAGSNTVEQLKDLVAEFTSDEK